MLWRRRRGGKRWGKRGHGREEEGVDAGVGERIRAVRSGLIVWLESSSVGSRAARADPPSWDATVSAAARQRNGGAGG